MIRKPGWSSFIVLSAVLSWGCASDSKSSDESAGAGALQIRPDASSPITPLVEAAGMNTENARAGALAGGDTAGTSTQSSPTSAGQASLQGGLNLGGGSTGGGLLNPDGTAGAAMLSGGNDGDPAGRMTDDNGCVSQATRRCIDGQPHWVNSCGLIENRIEICAEGQVCDNGTCVCNPMDLLPPMCEDGRVVQSDGCGLNPTVVDTCLPPTDCIDGRCLRPNCEPLDEICDGTDNDCDGRLDEEAPCPAGLSCALGRCSAPGTECQPCQQGANECAVGYTCVTYQNLPEIEGVCAKVGCQSDLDCDANSTCNPDGICVMRVTEECLGPNPWAIDSCGRQLLQIDECDPARPCMDGRCFGDGELCTQCEGDIDCADGFRCIGYAAYPEVPRVCVPESDCNEDPNAMCPDGLVCSPVGVCWMSITPTCRQDGDRWGVDTCNRDVFKIEECPANSLCRDDRCVGGGELCDVCQQDGDCTDGYVCGAYNEFPNVPAACVPESNCHIDPNVTCPEPLVCQDNGICAFAISLGCVEPNAIGRVDTCGRTLEALFLCPANSVCQDGQCILNASGGIPSSGGSPDTGGQQVGGGGTQSLVAGEPSQGGRVQSQGGALGGGRSSMGGAAGGGGRTDSDGATSVAGSASDNGRPGQGGFSGQVGGVVEGLPGGGRSIGGGSIPEQPSAGRQ